MPKGQNSGGRIPPDNRQAQAPGVGSKAKRHDLERRSVPYLHGSDLQQGDVAAMEQGQRVLPARTQQSAVQSAGPKGVAGAMAGGVAGGSMAGGVGSARSLSIPDPIDFISERARGSLGAAPAQVPQRRVDVSGWTPIVQTIANAPQASGLVRAAFLHQFSALARRPYVPDVMLVHLQALDAGVETDLNG